MEPQNQEKPNDGPLKPIDIVDLQKEVLEMREKIPESYIRILKTDFERFKERLANIVTEKSPPVEYSISIPANNTFEPNASQRYDEVDLTRYINNAEMFVNNLRSIREKRKI